METTESLLLSGAGVITPFEELPDCSVLIRDGKIVELGSQVRPRLPAGSKRFDLGGLSLLPGFIDIHTHGAAGVDAFVQAQDFGQALTAWSGYEAENGVTSFLPTVLTTEYRRMLEGIERLADALDRQDRPTGLLGINLEGPYISPRFGMQMPEYCRVPAEDDYEQLLERGHGHVKIMTVAPELEGADRLVRSLVERGIVPAIGHTGGDLEQTSRAIDSGAILATHLFNAFGYPQPAFRDSRVGKVCGVRLPGALEAVLARDEVYAELVSDRDGVHVHPLLQKIALRCKGADRTILVTDSMKPAGSRPGRYATADGREYEIDEARQDVIWLEEGTVIGGSVLKLRHAVRSLMRSTGLQLAEAVKTVTVNPARLLGLEKRIGSLEVGKLANLTAVDADMNVRLTVIGGRVVYESPGL